MEQVDALELVKECYAEYGAYVNSVRAVPRIEDGLKIVQRRLLLAARRAGASNSLTKSARVIGDTIGIYHPHGDSAAYEALVTLVNKEHSLFIGQGNWGYVQGFAEDPAAAQRYTEVKLSDLAKDLMLRYVDNAPKFVNQLGNEEPEYLPTPVPYALIAGTEGIGVGLRCVIPAFTKDSINECVKEFLTKGKIKSMLIPAASNGGWIDCDEENVRSLNLEGHGSISLGAMVEIEHDKTEDKNGIWVTGSPVGLNYKKILTALKSEIEQKIVYFRDDSRKQACIVFHRGKGVKRINDDDLYEKVANAASTVVACKIYVSDGTKAKLIGAREWLTYSLTKALEAYKGNTKAVINKLSLELKFHEIRKQLAAMLTAGKDYPEIRKTLDLTEEELAYCLAKSVRALSAKEFPTEEIREKLKDEKGKLKDLAASFLKYEPCMIK